jgi:AraC-like DNA-binding protein
VDVLGSVLRELRFESTEYRSLRLGAPFRISFAEPGLRGVHIVVEGECDVSVAGRPPRRLRAGDLVLFPRGDAHVLHSVGRVRGETQSGVALAVATERGIDVRGGGVGAETVVLCSTLRAVAVAVGYGSEAAFSAAFKRYTGTTPGAHRSVVKG